VVDAALIFAGLLAGAVLVALLVREIRRAKRLTAAAALAEAEARRSEERFRDVVEASSDWIWETDADYRLTFISGHLEELSGESPASTLGKRRWDLRLPDDTDDANWERHKAVIAARQSFRDFVFPYGDAGGGRRFCRVHGKPVFSNGVFMGYRGTGSDITDHRRVQAEMERQREALHQSEKLSALGSLLAGVAHELNNPLSVVVGHAAMLQELSPDEPTRERAGKIKAAADRCARIVRTFLAMARAKPDERAPVHMNAVVEGALDMLAYGLRTSGVEVARDLAPALPPVFASADQLHQVCLNLVINAQQALQGQGEGQARRLRVRTFVDDGRVAVEFADNGPGIPADIQKRIFDPFFTTKPMGMGTGIGLSVCRGIVLAHGGRIAVESRPGEGACFRLWLPPSGQPDAEGAAGRPGAAGAKAARILVVDDEVAIAELLAEILGRAGHEVSIVANGSAALDWLAAGSPELLISDLRMPGMDGPTLYRRLAAEHPDLLRRMLFITGDSLSPDLTAFLTETGVPVIEKPYDPHDVVRKVESALKPAA